MSGLAQAQTRKKTRTPTRSRSTQYPRTSRSTWPLTRASGTCTQPCCTAPLLLGRQVTASRTAIGLAATTTTQDEALLSFEIEVEGDAEVTLKELPVEITTGGMNIDDSIPTAYLLANDEVIGSENLTATDTDETVTFDELDYPMPAGETISFEVWIDINDLDDTADEEVAEGDTIQVQMTSTERDLIVAEDESGEDIETTDMTGTAIAETSAIFDSGINVEFVSSSYVKNASEVVDETVEFTLVFDITAFDDDMWIDQTCAEEDTGTDVDALEVYLSGDANFDNTSCTSFDSTGDEGTDGFEVKEGATERFTVTIMGDGAEAGLAGDAVTFRAYLSGIGYNVETDAVGDTVYTYGLEDFKSTAVTVFQRV